MFSWGYKSTAIKATKQHFFASLFIVLFELADVIFGFYYAAAGRKFNEFWVDTVLTDASKTHKFCSEMIEVLQLCTKDSN